MATKRITTETENENNCYVTTENKHGYYRAKQNQLQIFIYYRTKQKQLPPHKRKTIITSQLSQNKNTYHRATQKQLPPHKTKNRIIPLKTKTIITAQNSNN